MSYVHSVPGRLRVRTTRLRGRQGEAEHVRSRLLAVEGVQSVKVNDLTGSILVSYDCAAASLESVWSALFELGCVSQEAASLPAAVRQGADGTVSHLADKATSVFVEMLAQKVAEVSVMALVRALV